MVIKSESLLLVKQVKGTWACKSETLSEWLKQVKKLMSKFEENQVQHIPIELNIEIDTIANEQLGACMVGGINFQEPKMQ